MSAERKPESFRDFVRAELGLGWILAAALAVGLIAGSFGKLFQIPQEVYAFNHELEKEGLYEFFYEKFMPDLRTKPPQLYTRAQAEKVERVKRILAEHSPSFVLVMFMFLIGAALGGAFFLRLAAAWHLRLAKLEQAVRELKALPTPNTHSPQRDGNTTAPGPPASD